MKWLLISAAAILGLYAAFVFVFEAFYLGMRQPKLEATGIPMLVLHTTDAAGESDARRLARMQVGDKLYVSAHHWPRGWYRRAEANPKVQVEMEGVIAPYTAVPLQGEGCKRACLQERAHVIAKTPIPFVVNFLMGFPPEREIMRLDPR